MRRALLPLLVLLAASCRGAADRALLVSGTVEVTEVHVGSVLPGRIASVAVEEGQHVTKDQAVFTLDTSDLDARRAVATAAVAQAAKAVDVVGAQRKQAQEQSAYAEHEYARVEELAKHDAISDRDRAGADNQRRLANAALRTANEAYDQALAAKKSAEANLAAVGVTVGQATVLSPLDAVVLRRLREPGEVVAPGAAVLVLADASRPWVRVFVPEPRLSDVKVGAKATVRTDAASGNTFAATVTWISDQSEFTPRDVQTPEERVKQVFAVKLSVDDAKGVLKAGMPVDVIFGG